MIKRLIFVLSTVFFLVSCTTDGKEEHLFCKKLGFDIENEKICITAQLTVSGKNTPEKEGAKIVTRTAKGADEAIIVLEKEFDRILFKPLEEIVFGQTVDALTERKLMEKLVNQSEFQLKCKIRREPSARIAIGGKNSASENESVSFSTYFRNLPGGKENEKQAVN